MSFDLPTVVPPDLKPAVSPSVHLSLTVVYTVLYSFLFLTVYVQLWMILYYKHKRCSYQTFFLFLCLLWSGLRTSLFSFYFRNCVLANNLNTFAYWLLYCLPVCLQFITLCLLVLYFSQVVYKYDECIRQRILLRLALLGAMLIFVGTNIACAIMVQKTGQPSGVPFWVSMIRVGINDSLFIICGVALSWYIYKISKLPSSQPLLEMRGMSVCQAKTACALTIFLYTTRAVYNMIAISRPISSMLDFGYGWINVSDQADFMNLNEGFAYVSFGIVLFVWEFLPTFILVVLFRVRRPTQRNIELAGTPENPQVSRVYFFDDQRRYDSDEDLTRPLLHGASTREIGNGPHSINSTGGTPRSFGGSYNPAEFYGTPTIAPSQQTSDQVIYNGD